MELQERLFKHQLVDLAHDVEVFGNRQEGRRRDQALLRVIPAHQRLDADDIQRPGIKLRLDPGDEFLVLEALEDLVAGLAHADDCRAERIG